MEGMSLIEGLSNLNIETANLSLLKNAVPEHMISPLNTSVVQYVNDQQKKVELKNERNMSKNEELKESFHKEIKKIDNNMKKIALHNLKLILAGGIF